MTLKKTAGLSAISLSLLAGGFIRSQPVFAVDDAELAKQTQNPIASLISVPIKVDWDTDIGSADADRTTFVVQPVIPISLNEDWNVISRTIVPVYIDAESPVDGGQNYKGNGDVLQSFFFSPKKLTETGWTWGAGPALSLNTANDQELGSEKFSIGPTAVALKQANGWTFGGLTNHLWSVGGTDNRPDVNATFLQPFLVYTNKQNVSFGINSESTYNWTAEEWTAPVNLTVTKLMKFGKQPVSVQAGYRHYVDAPSGGPDWGLRFQVTLLYPK